MPLGQPDPIGVEHERRVEEGRLGQTQCPVQQQLPARRGEEVCASNNLCDAHGSVINNTGQLVARGPVAAEHHEVTKVSTSGLEQFT